MIAIDWGTTQLRAYRLDDTGAIVSRRSQPKGIMAISGGDFASALDEITRDWHGAADREVVMSGMIGSRGMGRGPLCFLPGRLVRSG
jgi:2-dehydro-3-deoxygalactonokinase